LTARLELADLVVRHGEAEALRGIRLAIAEGERVALMGPSGSGKTTLLRAALGLAVPASGEVRLDGKLASGPGRIAIPPEARGLAVVFQDLALFPHLTVQGNLDFGQAGRGLERAERARRIEAVLGRVGLAGRGSRRPGELSGGERQRVAIARALVLEPRLLLLDEPFASLDVLLEAELVALVKELAAERRLATLLVTHQPREARALGARVVVLEDGRITADGPAEALAAPAGASPFLRALAQAFAAGS
jgi:ABC-type Fe3+/spermidine/putrescine transport system ATPase subunit